MQRYYFFPISQSGLLFKYYSGLFLNCNLQKDAADSTQNRSSDSVKVEVPISHYSFCDTVGNDTMQTCVRIDFSGYRAKIDKAEYQQHLYIEPSVVEKKGGWSQFVGFGVQVGYGIGCANQMRFEPYIGVGVVYGFGYHWRKK